MFHMVPKVRRCQLLSAFFFSVFLLLPSVLLLEDNTKGSFSLALGKYHGFISSFRAYTGASQAYQACDADLLPTGKRWLSGHRVSFAALPKNPSRPIWLAGLC